MSECEVDDFWMYKSCRSDPLLTLSHVVFRPQGITAGIFIYVTFFEILNDEFSNGVNLMRLTTTLLGFVVMATLKAIPDGTDDSGHVTMATPP